MATRPLSLTLSLPTLLNNNYPLWHFALHNYLTVIGLAHFADAEVPAPAVDQFEALTQHHKQVAQVKRILGYTLPPQILVTVGNQIFSLTPHSIFQTLVTH